MKRALPLATFLGLDVSLNHTGVVAIDQAGLLTDLWYIAETASSASRHVNGLRWVRPKDIEGDLHRLEVTRLTFQRDFLEYAVKCAKLNGRPVYAGVEDYARGMDGSQAVIQLGEVGGAARLILFDNGIPFRLWDPTSLKMFAAHSGNAPKDDVRAALKARYSVDFAHLNPPALAGRNPNRTTEEDLVDAFGLAHLTRLEWMLRNGFVRLDELHAKEIQLFQRVTKAFKVNVLGREWIAK